MQSKADSAIPTVDVLGFPVANLDMAGAVAAIASMLEAHKAVGSIDSTGDTRGTGGARVVTANAEIMYRAYKTPELGALLLSADLILPDGIGVVKAAALRGTPLKERVAGADLMLALSAWAAANGRCVYLLGAAKASVEGTVSALHEQYPALRIAGYHDGYFHKEEKEEILRDIQAKGPDFLFVGMGFPAQDLFFTQNADRLSVGVMMGVGGTFDALSGRVKRAPQWIQRLNLEWAYRFAQNPKRLGRIWALPGFMLAVLLVKRKK